MSGTIAMSGRRVAITLAWSRSPRRSAEACMPATVTPVDGLTFEERARAGGEARMASMPEPEDRAAFARKGANAAHRPANLAKRIAKAWPEMDDDERAEVRSVLRKAGVIK